MISLGTVVGLLAVWGIAARHSVALICHLQDLRRDPAADTTDVVVRGTRDRLGPILTTTLVTAVLLLPVLILGDIAGLEIVQPMAVVVLGGLVTSTLLNLVVVPALYLRNQRRQA